MVQSEDLSWIPLLPPHCVPHQRKTPLSHFLSSLDWMIANCHPLLWVSQTQYQTFLSCRGLSLLLISNLMLVNRSGWMIALALQWLSRNFREKKILIFLSFCIPRHPAPSLVPVPAGQGLLWKWEEGVGGSLGCVSRFYRAQGCIPNLNLDVNLARMSSTCGPSRFITPFPLSERQRNNILKGIFSFK